MQEAQAYCYNASCPQSAKKQYSQRGLAVHLGRSPECISHVSLENGQLARSRNTPSTVHGHLDRSTTSAIATAVTLAHSNSTKRHRVLVNEAYPAGQDIPVPHNFTLPPQFDGLEQAGFSFHDDNDEATNTPMMSSTTSERSMVKLMKILKDISAPDYAVEVIIEWDQTALADGFDFCPKNKTRAGNVANLYNAVHNATLLLPSIVAVTLLEKPSLVDVIVYDFVPQYLSLLQDASLMTVANVNCNPADPCARFKSPGNMLGKLHSGSVYNWLYDKLITDPTRQLLAPIVL
jgi:hypothetical protein